LEPWQTRNNLRSSYCNNNKKTQLS
jgi:hypothetical protein